MHVLHSKSIWPMEGVPTKDIFRLENKVVGL